MTPNQYILCIDDDPMIARILEQQLACSVVPFSSISGFRSQASRYHPAAIFLDIHLGEECGIELISDMRQLWPGVPILVMTADDTLDWIGRALAAGAQDFLRKPLQTVEVKARLHVRQEEARIVGEACLLQFGNSRFDRRHRILSCGEKRLFLSSLEASILQVLFENFQQLCTREILINAAWLGITVSDNSLEQRIAGLRKALRFIQSDCTIKTQRRKGYALDLLVNSF